MVALQLKPHRRVPPAPRPLLSPVRPGASGTGALLSPRALFPSSPTRKAGSLRRSSGAAAAAAAAAEGAAAEGAAEGWAGPEPLGRAPQWGGPPAVLRPQRPRGDAPTQPRRAGAALEPHAGLVSAGA
jgi:hypothetical protein